MNQIRDKLNEDKTITPGMYRVKRGEKNVHYQAPIEERIWNKNMVTNILNTYEYTGALVQGKRSNLAVGSKKVRNVPVKDRVIVEAVHEALITKDDYKIAQMVIAHCKKGPSVNKDKYALGKKVYCGNCKKKMMHSGTKDDYMKCAHRRNSGKFSSCSEEKYRTSFIDSIVKHALKENLKRFRLVGNDIDETAKGNQADIASEKKKIKKQIELFETEKLQSYVTYAEGIMSKDEYINKKEDLSGKIEEGKAKLDEINKRIKSVQEVKSTIDSFMEIAEIYIEEGQLTETAVNMLIERVEIYDKEHIEITFKFDDVLKSAVEICGYGGKTGLGE